MRLPVAVLSLLLPLCAWAAPSEIDLASEAGFRSTCAALPRNAAALASTQQRQAFAICRDVELVQQVSTFLLGTEKHYSGAVKLSDDEARALLRGELTHIRDELRT